MEIDHGSSPRDPARRLPRTVLLVCLLGLLPAACERPEEATPDASAENADRSGTVEAFIRDGTVADSVRGHFRGTFIVAVFSEEGGYWVDIGRRAEMETTLGNPRPVTLVESVGDVPPGTYNRIRVLVCHSSVELEPGSRVGARTVDAPASVHLTETGDVIVEREVEPFRVGPERRVELDIDLNTERWLTEEAVTSDTASIPTFEREVSVRVRGVSEE